jgi:molecular chaperone DnaK (HSP70)
LEDLAKDVLKCFMWWNVGFGNILQIFDLFLANGTLTDSCVYYDQDSDVQLVGKQAANEKANNPENTICGMNSTD